MEAGRIGGEKQKPFLRRKNQGKPEAPPAGRRRPLRTRSRKKVVDTGWPSHGSRARRKRASYFASLQLSPRSHVRHQRHFERAHLLHLVLHHGRKFLRLLRPL